MLLLAALVMPSCSSWADNAADHREKVLILGSAVTLPSGCKMTDVKNRFICADGFGNEEVIGFNEGDGFGRAIEKITKKLILIDL